MRVALGLTADGAWLPFRLGRLNVRNGSENSRVRKRHNRLQSTTPPSHPPAPAARPSPTHAPTRSATRQSTQSS